MSTVRQRFGYAAFILFLQLFLVQGVNAQTKDGGGGAMPNPSVTPTEAPKGPKGVPKGQTGSGTWRCSQNLGSTDGPKCSFPGFFGKIKTTVSKVTAAGGCALKEPIKNPLCFHEACCKVTFECIAGGQLEGSEGADKDDIFVACVRN